MSRGAMFRRILLAVDGTSSSEMAISFATALAEQCSAAVHVLHVNEHLVGGRGLTVRTSDEAAQLVADAAVQLQSAGIEVSGAVCVSSYREVARRIAEIAEGCSADVILLGSSRRRHLERMFSRRVRARTLRLSSLPVLTAPSPLRFSKKGAQLELADAVSVLLERETTGSK
jgi:nucleotide-binding universal stress UspA family protein